MGQWQYEQHIVKLAHMLAGKQADGTVTQEALSFLGEAYDFDRGMVYEMDGQYRFVRAQHWAKKEAEGLSIPEEIPVGGEGIKSLKTLEPGASFFLRQGAESALWEREILHYFSCHGAAGISMTDENQEIYGLVLFLEEPSRKREPEWEGALSVLLPMLSRYVGVEMYRHRLNYARLSLESVLDNTGIDIYVNDFHTHDILYVNKSMAAPYGGVERFQGKKCWQVLFPGQDGPCEFCPQKQIIDEEGNPTKVYTWDYERAFDGSWFRVFSAAFRWTDGRLAHVVSSADITDNKRNEALIQYMANYDALTQLPNRRMLLSDCQKRIDGAKQGGRAHFLFFDIDGFKAINDTLGHEAGDEFLVQLGQFFISIPLLRQSIYRNGGDEFVAVLDGAVTKDQIQTLSTFIHDRFQQPWQLKKGEIYCNTSIGVASYPENGRTVEALLQQADQAMYRVKKAGGGDVFFCS